MATSGTYGFSPSNADIVSFAFSLCGIRRTALTAQHLADARTALNLWFSSVSNFTPNLWTVSLVSQVLTPGTATYNLASSVIMVLDAYITTGTGDSAFDRIIWPVSRSEYAAFPNKTLQAPPTVFWFDRLLSPTITLWQVPDDQQPYTLNMYVCSVIQDANIASGETPDIPPRWLMATVWGLAELLNQAYPMKDVNGAKIAEKAAQYLLEAKTQDVEGVPLVIAPAIGSTYYGGR